MTSPRRRAGRRPAGSRSRPGTSGASPDGSGDSDRYGKAIVLHRNTLDDRYFPCCFFAIGSCRTASNRHRQAPSFDPRTGSASRCSVSGMEHRGTPGAVRLRAARRIPHLRPRKLGPYVQSRGQEGDLEAARRNEWGAPRAGHAHPAKPMEGGRLRSRVRDRNVDHQHRPGRGAASGFAGGGHKALEARAPPDQRPFRLIHFAKLGVSAPTEAASKSRSSASRAVGCIRTSRGRVAWVNRPGDPGG